MRIVSSGGTPSILVFGKAFAILDLFTSEVPIHNFASIQESTGLPPSTCARLLQNLVAGGLLARDGSTYRVGPSVLRLARVANSSTEVADLVVPFVTHLRDATGETSGYFVADGSNRVCVLVAEARHSLMRRLAVGHSLPLHVGAPGRILLAFSSEARQAAVAAPRPRFSAQTVTEWAEIEKNLEATRQSRVALSEGEWEHGLSGIAAPVFHADGSLAGALAVSAPTARVSGDNIQELCDLVRDVADAASRQLGFVPSGQGRSEDGPEL